LAEENRQTVQTNNTVTSVVTRSSILARTEEDDAVIASFCILEWLGVHHTLHDGVIWALEVEIQDLQADDEKHELVKKKLGALLEASCLNASRKIVLTHVVPLLPVSERTVKGVVMSSHHHKHQTRIQVLTLNDSINEGRK
jgi:hypothetical protein